MREHRPGDPADEPRVTHDLPGIPFDDDMPGLEQRSRQLMKGPPIHLTLPHAEALLTQFQETAQYRHWELRVVSIMFNHFHIVVGVMGDPSPSKVLGDFKSYGTRALSKQFGAPLSETWWTECGSERKLPNEAAILAAIHYVLHEQPSPLVIWFPGMASVRA